MIVFSHELGEMFLAYANWGNHLPACTEFNHGQSDSVSPTLNLQSDEFSPLIPFLFYDKQNPLIPYSPPSWHPWFHRPLLRAWGLKVSSRTEVFVCLWESLLPFFASSPVLLSFRGYEDQNCFILSSFSSHS